VNREQKKQQTRLNLLATARRLFQEKGFDAVSTRDIAKESGVGVGTVFAHFPDKQELTKALFHMQIDEQLANRAILAAQQKTGLDYFLCFTEMFYGFYEQDRAFSMALLKNSMFDAQYFQGQMDQFITQVAERLTTDLPNQSSEQRVSIAKAWFGYYMFQVIIGLSQPEKGAKDWQESLKNECQTLVAAINI